MLASQSTVNSLGRESSSIVLKFPNMDKILVVEDDRAVQKALKRLFEGEGFAVEICGDGQSAIDSFRANPATAVVLDLRLPAMSGRDVCREIKRQSPAVPILILSAASDVADKVLLLELGADDYVTKPFSISELLARIRANLRRAGAGKEEAFEPIDVGDFHIDLQAHVVTVQGKEIHLTPKEFDLLAYMARHPGKVLTHRMLLNAVWGGQSSQSAEYLWVFMNQLRKKIEPDDTPRYIVTEPRIGYRFRPEKT